MGAWGWLGQLAREPRKSCCGAQGNVSWEVGGQVPGARHVAFWKWFLCRKLVQGMFIKEAETGPTVGQALILSLAAFDC